MQPHISKQHQQGATLIVALVFLVVLTAAGVLSRRQQGTWAHFRVVPERLSDIADFFEP